MPAGGAVDEFACTIEESPGDECLVAIERGIEAYDRDQGRPDEIRALTVVGRSRDGTLVGGLTGTVGGGWLYVYQLSVAPEYRGQGLGRALLETAERETLQQGCPRVFLNTLSYQAPVFYERCGYTVFAELDETPAPHSRVFYRKDLASVEA
jgi:GNAT superfamily N-acetyltransferase